MSAYSQRRVIDSHVHLNVDRLEDAIRLMDQNGIEAAIDVSPNPFASLREKISAFNNYPGRFYACCGIDPADFGTPGWVKRECERLAKAAEMGAMGVKFAKNWGLTTTDGQGRLIPINHEALDPIYGQAGRLGMVVVFHVADPKAFFRRVDEKNERYEELSLKPDWSFADRGKYPYDWWQLVRQIEKVIKKHPTTRFVGAHFSCAAEEPGYVADVLRDNPNYNVDIAARIGELGRCEPDYMRRICLEFQDRIMFATDICVRKTIVLGAPQDFEPNEADVKKFYDAHWRYLETNDKGIDHPTPIQGNWKVDAIGLPREVLDKIYRENARRLVLGRR